MIVWEVDCWQQHCSVQLPGVNQVPSVIWICLLFTMDHGIILYDPQKVLHMKLEAVQKLKYRNSQEFILAHFNQSADASGKADPITIFLCGDVMTGRAIDQVLPSPSDPCIHEPVVKNAVDYVAIAEKVNDSIPMQRPVSYVYIWGEALGEVKQEGDVTKLFLHNHPRRCENCR